jgi:LysR family transcriptional regulator, cyn operon transcriptional activator
MNLQQLRYVVATAEVGTMTDAAAGLHVAQPALSRAVRALEHEIGVTIFARDGRGLRLTDEGREVVAIASRVVAEVERLTLVGSSTTIRVAATKGQARELASPAMNGDGSQLVVEDTREDVFEAVRGGRAHLGIVELPAPGDLDFVSLGWQEILLVHPRDWDLPDPLPIHRLADMPLVVAPTGDWRREALESGLRAHGIAPNVVAETTERDILLRLVVEGAGATFSYGRQAALAQVAGAKLTHFDPPAVREVGIVHTVALIGETATFVERLQVEAVDLLIGHGDARLARAGRVAGATLLCRGHADKHPARSTVATPTAVAGAKGRG